eukprot:scaffold1048_cov135-Skeletonema_marinoi.AAC.9
MLSLHHYAAASAFEVIVELSILRDPVTRLFPFHLTLSKGNYEASCNLLLANLTLYLGYHQSTNKYGNL